MSAFFDRIWFQATAGGTGTFTVSSAVTGYRTPATASIPNGTIVTYVAESADKSQWEIGVGTYTTSGTTLSRDVVRSGTNGTSLVNFSAAPSVFLDLAAAEVFPGWQLDAVTNAITYSRLTHETTGTPAIGIGTGIEFAAETTAGNVEIGATIEAVTTTVTAAAENFDLVFKTMNAGAAAAERMRIDNAGRLLIGVSVSETISGHARLHVSVDSNVDWDARFSAYGSNAFGASNLFTKTRGAAAATHTILQNNDVVGLISFYGSEGTGWRQTAKIQVDVDAAPVAGTSVLGRIGLYTASDGSGAVERMRIESSGRANIGRQGANDSTFFGARIQFEIAAPTSVWNTRFHMYGNDAVGAGVIFSKSRAATVSGVTLVTNNDTIGQLNFYAADGSVFNRTAILETAVDGTASAGIIPSRLTISTSDTTGARSERFRIDNAGLVAVNPAGGTPLNLSNVPGRFNVACNSPTNRWTIAMRTFANAANGPSFGFSHSRNTTIGSHTIVAADDRLLNMQVYGSDGTADREAASMRVEVDGTPGASDMPGRWAFYTTPDGSATPVERMRIDNQGRANFGLAGFNTSLDAQIFKFEVSNQGDDYTARFHAFGDFNGPPVLTFSKTRGATHNAFNIVQSGDLLGAIMFVGADGTDFAHGAWIRAIVDATPGAGDMPTRLSFWTSPDGAEVPVERMRINNAGLISMGTTNNTFVGGGATRLTLAMKPNDGGVPLRIAAYDVDGFGANIQFTYTRHTTDINGAGLVSPDDEVGSIEFKVSDGTTTFRRVARISALVDGTAASTDTPGRLVFWTTPDGTVTITERMRIDNGGNVNINHGGAMVAGGGFGGQRFSVAQDTNVKDVVAFLGYGANTFGPAMTFSKTRNASVGGETTVVNGDNIGIIDFRASDGTSRIQGGQIAINVDGTVTTNNLPCSIIFGTGQATGNTGSATERARIDSSGNLRINGASAQAKLAIAASTAVDVGINVSQYGTSGFACGETYRQTRGSGPDAQGSVLNGDYLWHTTYQASDGTAFRDVASMYVYIAATPSGGFVPGQMSFYVASATVNGSSNEVLRLTGGGGIDLPERTPTNPAANFARIYAKDESGITKLAFRDSAGTETVLGAGGAGGSPTGSDGQLQYKSGSSFAAANLWHNSNVVEQRNAANAQSIWVHNTTDGTNKEYASLNWVDTANRFIISTKNAGTGTVRDLEVNRGSGGAIATVWTSTGVENYISGNQRLVTEAAGIFVNGAARFGGSDVAIVRNAAGVLEINSTSAGTFRDLILRNLFVGSATDIVVSRLAAGNMQIEGITAATNAVQNLLKLKHSTTGTPAAGIGIGIQFEVETATTPNVEIGVVLECVTTDVTGASEDFDWIIKTMAAGATAAERLRVSQNGITPSTRNLDKVQTLTDGASVALDARTGNVFKLLAAGNRTISAPTNKPASGEAQRIIIMHEASGADRTLALTTGSAGAFRFGTDVTALTATTNGLVDYIGCVYNVGDDRWDVVSYTKGF